MLGAPLRDRSASSRRLFLVPLLAAALTAVGIPAAATASAAPNVIRAAGSTHTSHAHVPTHHLKPAHHSAAAKRASFGRGVLAEASRHAGARYVYGAAGPGAFDCSGFTSYVYRQLGVSLPRSSYQQYAVVEHLPRSAAVPGDLIFLDGLGHVAIYAGHGMMWDAPTPGGRVSKRHIYSSVYQVGRVRL